MSTLKAWKAKLETVLSMKVYFCKMTEIWLHTQELDNTKFWFIPKKKEKLCQYNSDSIFHE
jgi:hypothetical protein